MTLMNPKAISQPSTQQISARKGFSQAIAANQRRSDAPLSSLMPSDQWFSLAPSIRHRFSQALEPHKPVLYQGHIIETKFSAVGFFLANCARLIGSPLPYQAGGKRAATVSITPSKNSSNQCWTRIYQRDRKFPHVTHSFQRFEGKTGLEEYIGYGMGIALNIRAEKTALIFESAFYFIQIFQKKFPIPSWGALGKMKIIHKAESSNQFSLTMTLTHPLFGFLISQKLLFEDFSHSSSPLNNTSTH